MTEDYPFGLSPGAQLIVTSQMLNEVLVDITGLIALEQGVSDTMRDVLMVSYTYAKQSAKALQEVRLLHDAERR